MSVSGHGSDSYAGSEVVLRTMMVIDEDESEVIDHVVDVMNTRVFLVPRTRSSPSLG